MSKKTKFYNIIECASELEQLAKSKGKNRLKLINQAKNCVINAISELAKNCLVGNIALQDCDFKKLKKYQQVLRQISKKLPIKTRRDLIIQEGGFLPLLISPALSLVAGIVGKQISNLISK